MLEFISFFLLVRFNPYHSAAYFYTSNQVSGNIYQWRSNVRDYFFLSKANEDLALENAWLREQVYTTQQVVTVENADDTARFNMPVIPYEFINARVINNSIQKFHNFLTINKGTDHGIEAGMGVISPSGIVGKVFTVSDRFATVSSLLNVDVLTSAIIKRDGTFCTVKWNGSDPRFINLLYVPRHVPLLAGDTVLTSGYNAVFPENIMIGTIEEVELRESETFYDIKVRLSNNFYTLSHVYIVKNPLQEERDELESKLPIQ